MVAEHPDMESAEAPLQLLTFRLKSDVFAIQIEKVQEVVEVAPMTRLPGSSDAVRGLLNLRGRVIPVVDLSAQLDLGPTADTVDTCIIVAELQVGEETAIVGALSDAVKEVTEVAPSTLIPPPTLGTLVQPEFIRSLAQVGEDLVVVLDFDRLFQKGDLGLDGPEEAKEEAVPEPVSA